MKSKSKIAGILSTLLVAFVILSISVIKSTSPHRAYAYTPMVLSEKVEAGSKKTIDYLLPYPGKIRPDNPVWYIKVLRDKALLASTFNSSKKAELNLLYSDKRLGSSLELFKDNKPDLGLSTLTKSAKYLETASEKVGDDKDLYSKIALSALKHREVIENEILPICPEDLRPQVIKTTNYSNETYTKMKEKMSAVGLIAPVNPFETN